ncbi:MAG: FAD-dependent oxidoreductase, partial [bacterium]
PGEKEFLGHGVSYCAACDGPLFKNKTVAVVGGSDCAAISATFLADICQKVYIIYRKDQLRCEPIWLERLNKNPKMVIINNAEIKEIKGEQKVSSLVLEDGKELAVDGVFVEIGAEPNVAMLKSLGIKLDEKNHVIIDQAGATSVKGVYAAGDITTGSNKFRQVITAASEGVIAVVAAAEYLKKQ